MANFAELIAATPVPYARFGKPAARLIRQKKKDVQDIKKKVASRIAKQSRRILIVIDDIDRLTGEEIRQLFRLVKAVADFPNVLYLLAFDKEVVIKALDEFHGIPGKEYLEKIVQVPFELPSADKAEIRPLFFERLSVILRDTHEELFDPTTAMFFMKGLITLL